MNLRTPAGLNRLIDAAGHDAVTDRDLLHRFLAVRDEAAFESLVRRHQRLVGTAVARVLSDPNDAADAFQATFLVLVRRAGSIDWRAGLGPWLYGVAHRVAVRARADRRQRAEAEVRAAARPAPPPDLSWREACDVLHAELDRLPDRYRVPVLLCYLEGRTRDEAATALGLSVGAVKGRVRRGCDLLRGRLARQGVTLSAGLITGVAAGPSPALPAAVPSAVAASVRGAASARVVQLAQEGVMGSAVWRLAIGLVTTAAVVGAGIVTAGAGGGPRPEPPTPARVADQPATAPTLDADGRPLPPGAILRLGSRRFRTEGRNSFLLPTPDGRHVLVLPRPPLNVAAAHGLFLLDADTGLRVRAFEDGHRVPKTDREENVRPAAFSPDGTRLYAVAWDPARIKGAVEDSQVVNAYLNHASHLSLLVWDVRTGKKVAEWPLPPGNEHGASLLDVAVSADGKRVLVSGSIRLEKPPARPENAPGVAGIHVLDAATGARLQTWEGVGLPAGTVVGGKEIVTFRDTEVTAIDAATGAVVRTYSHAGPVLSAAVSPDGRLVAAAGPVDGANKVGLDIRVWDAATGREVRRLSAAQTRRGRLAFAADGRTLFLGTGEGRVLRWSLPDGAELPDWAAHTGAVADLFTRPRRAELVTGGASDNAVRRWDAADGKPLSAVPAYVGEVAAARTPDRKGVAIIDEAGRLDVWDAATGRVTRTLRTPGRKHHQLIFTPDGRQLLVAAEAGPNTVWDWAEGKQVGEFAPPPKPDPKAREVWWHSLRFSPDGRRLIGAKYGCGTWAWSWPERAVLWHDAREKSCAILPDNRTMVCWGSFGPVRFCDPDTRAVRREVSWPGTGRVERTLGITVFPDGRRVVSGEWGSFQVRDLRTGRVLKDFRGVTRATAAAFSPTGWLMAVLADNAVRVYDTLSWAEVARLGGHDGTVEDVFFGPDDFTLVTASPEDGTALVWSLRPPAGPAPDPAKLWADLAGDGPAVRAAIGAVARYPGVAVRLFRERWPASAAPLDAERVRALIADLDNPRFAAREAASAELARVGRRAEGELRAVAASGSPEARQRAESLLGRLTPRPLADPCPPEEARKLRAVWALELAGTPEAQKLLADWAAAGADTRLADEAAAAVRRAAAGPK